MDITLTEKNHWPDIVIRVITVYYTRRITCV